MLKTSENVILSVAEYKGIMERLEKLADKNEVKRREYEELGCMKDAGRYSAKSSAYDTAAFLMGEKLKDAYWLDKDMASAIDTVIKAITSREVEL